MIPATLTNDQFSAAVGVALAHLVLTLSSQWIGRNKLVELITVATENIKVLTSDIAKIKEALSHQEVRIESNGQRIDFLYMVFNGASILPGGRRLSDPPEHPELEKKTAEELTQDTKEVKPNA